MPLLTSLLVLIVVARLLGRAFQRMHQPAIVGEMLAGVLLGPSLLNLIQPNAALSAISELAVFLVVLSAGLEMNFKDIVNALRGRGVIIAALGFVIPFFAETGRGHRLLSRRNADRLSRLMRLHHCAAGCYPNPSELRASQYGHRTLFGCHSHLQ